MAMKSEGEQAIAIGQKLAAQALLERRNVLERREAAIAAAKPQSSRALSESVKRGQNVGVLIAEGDSWFDYPKNDVLKGLEDDFGYEVESVSRRGDWVEAMAYADGQLEDLLRKIEKIQRRDDRPKAILLSGGGNDIAGKIELGTLLDHSGSANPGLNEKIVSAVIDDRLYEAYITIVSAVTTVCIDKLGGPVPIIIHGYAYPVPDGRGYGGGFGPLPGPWLEPAFRLKGYDIMNDRIAMIAALMDRFNAMLQRVESNPAFPHVRFLDLRETLSNGADYKNSWANELHPSKEGFQKVTSKFAALIATL